MPRDPEVEEYWAEKRRKNHALVPWLTLAFGLASLAGALYRLPGLPLALRGVATTGTVTKVERLDANARQRETLHAARGTFQTSTGRTVEFRGAPTRSTGFRAGDQVALVYDPEDPSHTAFPYELEDPGGSLFLAASGLIGTGLGIFLVRRRLRGDDDPWVSPA